MLTAPLEVAARPLPAAVIALSLLLSAGFLYALTLPGGELGSWVEQWGLVSRELLRELGQGGLGPRVLTPWSALMLHENLAHLCGNLFYLWLFGEALEFALGRLRFVVLFLLSAFAAAVVHVAALPQAYLPALGASGAISGLVGAYLICHHRLPSQQRWHPLGVSPLVFLVLWGVLVAFAALTGEEGYAGWAHVGGFCAGAGACGVLAPRFRGLTTA